MLWPVVRGAWRSSPDRNRPAVHIPRLKSKTHLPVTPNAERLLGRRCVLSTLTAAALVGCFVGDTTGQDAGDDAAAEAGDDAAACDPSLGKRVGAQTAFPAPSWTLVGQLIVAQDANGFFAFSAICTHQGCLVNPPSSKTGSTFCACHGSRFDGNGAVLVGPANTPLPHYAVNLCNGDVYVDTTTRVNPSTRTPAV
jgi:Rieske Fe-S protein